MDLAIVQWVSESLHTPLLDQLMPLITHLGDMGLVWVLIGIALLCFRRTRRYGAMLALAMLLGLLVVNLVLKNMIARPRPFTLIPELILLIPQPSEWSFPSGHACSSFAAATSVFFCSKRFGIAALSLAALITFSRLYLSVHYPTDLLAGALLGILCAFAARWLIDRYYSRTA